MTAVALSPEDRTKRPRPATYLCRAVASHVRGFVTKVPAESAARSLFGRDPTLEIVLRAATSPASVTNSGWAGALAAQVVDDFVASIAVLSAGAALIGRGMRLDFAGYASIRIPGRIFDLDNAGN